jgi:hypothetical protein
MCLLIKTTQNRIISDKASLSLTLKITWLSLDGKYWISRDRRKVYRYSDAIYFKINWSILSSFSSIPSRYLKLRTINSCKSGHFGCRLLYTVLPTPKFLCPMTDLNNIRNFSNYMKINSILNFLISLKNKLVGLIWWKMERNRMI